MVETGGRRELSQKDLKAAQKYGGSEVGEWQEYIQVDGVPSFDKGGHLARSLYHRQEEKVEEQILGA